MKRYYNLYILDQLKIALTWCKPRVTGILLPFAKQKPYKQTPIDIKFFEMKDIWFSRCDIFW